MEEFDEIFENIDNDVEDADEIQVVNKRYIRDTANPIEVFADEEFQRRYRFTKNCVTEILLPIIEVELVEPVTERGLPIPAIYQLLISLRWYASNSFQIVHGDLRGFSQSSISRVVKRVSIAFARRLGTYVKFPENVNQQQVNTAAFYNIANFPNVSGCVDGTHIAISNPGGDNGEAFRNRKGWFSLNVQVVAGPRLEILDIVVRYPGSAHDSLIFNRSSLRARFHRNEIPGLLLGDSAYACSNKLLTPFLAPKNAQQERYNAAHIRTRNTVERLIEIWKRRFFCLRGGIRLKLPTTMAVICATAVLYNISISHNQNFILNDPEPDDIIELLHVNNEIGGSAFRRAFAETHF